jgi:hypothetical protein
MKFARGFRLLKPRRLFDVAGTGPPGLHPQQSNAGTDPERVCTRRSPTRGQALTCTRCSPKEDR